jgi:hypothetical protein
MSLSIRQPINPSYSISNFISHQLELGAVPLFFHENKSFRALEKSRRHFIKNATIF